MRKVFMYLGIVIIGATIAAAANYTKQSYVQMTNSLIDSTPVGNTTPAAGRFLALSATALNNTPIGNTGPSTGNFTSLNATNGTFGNLSASTANVSGALSSDSFNTNHMTWRGTAPLNQVLMGNGSELILQPLPAIPPSTLVYTVTEPGCSFPAYNNLVSCQFTFTFNGVPFPDTGYNLIGCIANSNNGASVIVAQRGPANSSGVPMVATLVMINGAPGGWTPNITCSAWHP